MKKIAVSVVTWPVLVLVGWLATRLSERYEEALDNIDYELGLDD